MKFILIWLVSFGFPAIDFCLVLGERLRTKTIKKRGQSRCSGQANAGSQLKIYSKGGNLILGKNFIVKRVNNDFIAKSST
jgi:hypothetical protein